MCFYVESIYQGGDIAVASNEVNKPGVSGSEVSFHEAVGCTQFIGIQTPLQTDELILAV